MKCKSFAEVQKVLDPGAKEARQQEREERFFKGMMDLIVPRAGAGTQPRVSTLDQFETSLTYGAKRCRIDGITARQVAAPLRWLINPSATLDLN